MLDSSRLRIRRHLGIAALLAILPWAARAQTLLDPAGTWSVVYYPTSSPDSIFAVYGIRLDSTDAGDGSRVYTLADTQIGAGATALHPPHSLRETTDGRVYLKSHGRDVEELLYDYSLQVGDVYKVHTSLDTSDLQSQIRYVVTARDTVVFGDGLPRVRIALDGYRDPVWIEGIGSTLGLLPDYIFPLQEAASRLRCYREGNGETVYSGGGDCLALGIADGRLPSVVVAPNPATEWTRVDLPVDYLGGAYTLYDTHGRIVARGQLDGDARLNVSVLPKGVYTAILRDRTGHQPVAARVIRL